MLRLGTDAQRERLLELVPDLSSARLPPHQRAAFEDAWREATGVTGASWPPRHAGPMQRGRVRHGAIVRVIEGRDGVRIQVRELGTREVREFRDGEAALDFVRSWEEGAGCGEATHGVVPPDVGPTAVG